MSKRNEFDMNMFDADYDKDSMIFAILDGECRKDLKCGKFCEMIRGGKIKRLPSGNWVTVGYE